MALTDEDKTWFAAQLGVLRAESSERINALRAEFSEHVSALRAGFSEQLSALRAEFIQRLEAQRIELSDRIEKSETTLLTEFHKWASPVELRQRSHAAAMRAFDAELEAVSERVTKLERPAPPAA
jgi:hypothetical protein